MGQTLTAGMPPAARLSISPDTLDFELPPELIAQEPLRERDRARLLVLNRATGALSHHVFSDLLELLRAGDVLVLNKARVSHAKLVGRKPTGGRVEVIFTEPTADPFVWKALVRPLMDAGARFRLGADTEASLVGRTESGDNLVRTEGRTPPELMELDGRVPLPPYIKRADDDPRHASDARDYQTVYALVPGSVAAPTAGLHFSEELLNALRTRGVQIETVLLHVGWGTFKPVADRVDRHVMLPERYEVAPATFERLQRARADGRRIIAVGTTSTRTIESLSPEAGVEQLSGATRLFIRPGFEFRWLSGLVTNLHVPKSTPVALTAAFAGLEHLSAAYAAAVAERYRFFSYGDAMLVL